MKFNPKKCKELKVNFQRDLNLNWCLSKYIKQLLNSVLAGYEALIRVLLKRIFVPYFLKYSVYPRFTDHFESHILNSVERNVSKIALKVNIFACFDAKLSLRL